MADDTGSDDADTPSETATDGHVGDPETDSDDEESADRDDESADTAVDDPDGPAGGSDDDSIEPHPDDGSGEGADVKSDWREDFESEDPVGDVMRTHADESSVETSGETSEPDDAVDGEGDETADTDAESTEKPDPDRIAEFDSEIETTDSPINPTSTPTNQPSDPSSGRSDEDEANGRDDDLNQALEGDETANAQAVGEQHSSTQAAPAGSPPGASPVGAGAGATAPAAPTSAPDDQEMPLTEHIEEMVTRLGVVIVVMALVSGVVFPFADRLINFLWYSFLPGTIEQCPVPPADLGPNEVACPTLYHPLALMFARLKVASLAGFVVALPVMVYESYLFMRPGLYPRERRYYLASVPTSLVLACAGVLFAYFLVLPVLFQYFTGYTSSAADIAFGLTDTFNLIVMMMGFFALVFQIPLLIMLAIMMGVTSRRWLADKRLYFWGGFATVAFIFSPDPTGMAPILVAVTMIALFESTLLLLRWTGS